MKPASPHGSAGSTKCVPSSCDAKSAVRTVVRTAIMVTRLTTQSTPEKAAQGLQHLGLGGGASGKQCKQARVTPNLFFGSSGNGSWFAWCGRKRPPSSSSDRYTHKTVTFFSFWTLGASAPRGMGAWRLAAACAWAVGLGGQRCRASTLLIREAGGDPVALDYGTCVFKCEWRAIERRRGRVSKVSRRNVYLVLTWARSAISALWAHFPLVARRPIKTTRRA